MTLVLVEPSRSLPLLSISITFRVGAVHEPAERAGLARVAGRMLRRGSGGLPSDEVEQRVDELGGDLGVHVGHGTSSVVVECLARSTDAIVDLCAQIVAEPTFAEDELGKLVRQSVAEIARTRDDDAFLCSRALRRNLFAGRRHGRRVAGSVAGLESIDRDAVVAFHRQHYCKQNAVVAVAGDVDEAGAARLAERLLAGLPEGERAVYPLEEPPPLAGRRLVIVDKPERSQTQLGIATMGTHPTDDDHVALALASTALGGTFSSRLMQEVRVKRGWSYGVSSQLSVGRVRETFNVWSAPGAEDAAACLALELELLDAWRNDGLAAGELDFCKHYIRRSWPFEIDTPKKRLQQKLERALLELDDDFHARFLERVSAVSLDEANAAVRRRIDPTRMWIGAVCTEASIGTALRAAIPALADHVVEAYDLE
jgi:zinc protease